MEEDELRDALRDGTTLAELATQNGVEPQAVIDALVAEATERIDRRRQTAASTTRGFRCDDG